MELNTLVQFSNRYGADPNLVLAGGGNTSAKGDGALYVKASGVSLAEIKAEGFVKIDLEKLKRVFGAAYPEEDAAREAAVLRDMMNARFPSETAKRPSVETPLHALFPQTYVLHLHPALVNGLTCSRGAEEDARKFIGLDFIWIDSCKPGYMLSQTCAAEMAAYRQRTGKEANLILLQNHGIFIAADSAEELDALLWEVMFSLEKRLKHRPEFPPDSEPSQQIEAVGQTLAALYPKPMTFRYCGGGDWDRFSLNEKEAQPLLRPFSPDHIVYCKAYPLYIGEQAWIEPTFSGYVARHGYEPRVLIVGGFGFFCFGETEKQAETCRALLTDALKIAVYAESFGGYLHLDENLTEFIINWEVESYRSAQN